MIKYFKIEEKEYIKACYLKDCHVLETITKDMLVTKKGFSYFDYCLSIYNVIQKRIKTHSLRFCFNTKEYEYIIFIDKIYVGTEESYMAYVTKKQGITHRTYSILISCNMYEEFEEALFAVSKWAIAEKADEILIDFYNAIVTNGYYCPACNINSYIVQENVDDTSIIPLAVESAFVKAYPKNTIVKLSNIKSGEVYYGVIGWIDGSKPRKNLSDVFIYSLKEKKYDKNKYFREYYTSQNWDISGFYIEKVKYYDLPYEEMCNCIDMFDIERVKY